MTTPNSAPPPALLPVTPEQAVAVLEATAALAQQVLAQFPELESLMVIPSWATPSDSLPSGILLGQNGEVREAGALNRMSWQLLRCQHGQQLRTEQVLLAYDQYAGRLAAQIQAAHARLQTEGLPLE